MRCTRTQICLSQVLKLNIRECRRTVSQNDIIVLVFQCLGGAVRYYRNPETYKYHQANTMQIKRVVCDLINLKTLIAGRNACKLKTNAFCTLCY